MSPAGWNSDEIRNALPISACGRSATRSGSIVDKSRTSAVFIPGIGSEVGAVSYVAGQRGKAQRDGTRLAGLGAAVAGDRADRAGLRPGPVRPRTLPAG